MSAGKNCKFWKCHKLLCLRQGCIHKIKGVVHVTVLTCDIQLLTVCSRLYGEAAPYWSYLVFRVAAQYIYVPLGLQWGLWASAKLGERNVIFSGWSWWCWSNPLAALLPVENWFTLTKPDGTCPVSIWQSIRQHDWDEMLGFNVVIDLKETLQKLSQHEHIFVDGSKSLEHWTILGLTVLKSLNMMVLKIKKNKMQELLSKVLSAHAAFCNGLLPSIGRNVFWIKSMPLC